MNLILRADASVAIGTGHVMRCLALAQAWQDAGGHAVFAVAETTPAINERLRREGYETVGLAVAPGTHEDSDQTARLAADRLAKWVVVDGYRFGADFQRALVASGLKVLFIDDNANCKYYAADLLLNQNVYAEAADYRNRAPATKLLMGLRYALLRREFTQLRSWERQIPTIARNLLVTMGGSDPTNLTPRVLQALEQIDIEHMNVRIAIGGSNPHRASLEKSASQISGCVELLNDVQNMAELIASADVGVAAAGTVSWEICALGLPSLLVPVADNQMRAAEELGRLGAALILRPTFGLTEIASTLRELMQSASSREKISARARALLDLDGPGRVVAEILASSN
jgi:UDP-2,4-diacetamido-2,4,6-trideoxy-beta-L-altropyranose hydrolase